MYGDMSIAEVPDGWIIAFDAGEWGGALWWFSPDGTTRRRISDDQVLGFARTEPGLIALEGIAHGVSSKGKVIKLVRSKTGAWVAHPLVDLGFAPMAYYKDSPKSVVVATTDQLVRVHVDRAKLEVLVPNAFWTDLYPTSVIGVKSQMFYIGMRHGVARVERKGSSYEVRWLTPQEERAGPFKLE
jgi:hypothetical protein